MQGVKKLKPKKIIFSPNQFIWYFATFLLLLEQDVSFPKSMSTLPVMQIKHEYIYWNARKKLSSECDIRFIKNTTTVIKR